MYLRPSAVTLARAAAAALAVTVSAAALAQANSFQLTQQGGRVLGKASYTFDKTKDGYKIKSRFEYKSGLPPVAEPADPDKPAAIAPNVTESQFTAEYKVDASGNFLSGFMQNAANQMMTSFSPNKTRDSVVIAQIQGGVSGESRTLSVPQPDFLVAADYDPSAIQVLLTGALAHPHANHTYMVVVPAGAKGSNNALYLTLADPTDAAGTLDGKPIALKRYALAWNKSKGALYADTAGTLMQADIGPLKASYVRAKFALVPQPAP